MNTLAQKVNLADVIKVVVFIVALAGTWYSMKYEVQSLNDKVNRLEKKLDDTNLGVIKNDITYIKDELKEIHDHLSTKFSRKNSKGQSK